MRSGTVALLAITMFGCGNPEKPTEDASASTTSSDEEGSTTEIGASSSATSAALESSSSDGDESSSTDVSAPTFGEPESLPTPDGACPSFEPGTLAFAPGETGPRSARVWVDPEAGGGGPLVFYWHGTGSSPLEAEFGIGQAGIDDILARGGMVVAPVSDPEAGQFPWYLVLGQEEDDIHLMDEIVGCAAQGPGIDASRIHALGMSAGGLQTSQVSTRRSSYIASVVTYSGGILNPEIVSDDPDRPFPALIYHGGPDDIVVISFQQASERYRSHIQSLGGYSVICDHGGAHTIPDARVFSWQFLLDHPFDISPPPYEGNLPEWLPEYCIE